MGVALETIFDPAAYPQELVQCNLCGGDETQQLERHDRYGLPTSIVRCVSCGLEFISPRMTAEGYAAFYRDGYRPLVDTWLANMGRVANPDADAGYPELLVHVTRKWAPPTGRVLDLGGSTGTVSAAFAKRYGYDVTVVDPAIDELAQAQGEKVCASAETVTFAQQSFDLILCCRALDHFLDPKAALAKMRTWIRPGGILICDVMDTANWPFHSRYKVDHPYAFTRNTLLKMLNATGWSARMRWTLKEDKYVGFVCGAA